MKVGDQVLIRIRCNAKLTLKDTIFFYCKVFFYHSNAGSQTGIVGTAYVAKEAYPDPTSFDKKSKYYDSKTSKDNPKWFMVR